jgi:hypothetical protein
MFHDMLLRLAILTAFMGCQSAPPPKELDGQAALTYAKTQVEFGPRIPGTEGHRKTAEWIDSLIRQRADSVVVQAWTHRTKSGDSLPMRNLIGRWNVSAERRLLFLAHWDTRPVADSDTGTRSTQPVPGANDGASGVAVLLAMADALKKLPPVIGVDLLFVDGEDYGTFPDTDVLIGSSYYAKNQVAGPRPEYAVLLDMVGGKGSVFPKEGYSVTAAPAVVDLVWQTAARVGAGSYFPNETSRSITDDHVPLQQVGIRAIDVVADFGPSTSFPYHHTVDDTVDKLAAATLQAVGDVMMALIREAKRVK